MLVRSGTRRSLLALFLGRRRTVVSGYHRARGDVASEPFKFEFDSVERLSRGDLREMVSGFLDGEEWYIDSVERTRLD